MKWILWFLHEAYFVICPARDAFTREPFAFLCVSSLLVLLVWDCVGFNLNAPGDDIPTLDNALKFSMELTEHNMKAYALAQALENADFSRVDSPGNYEVMLTIVTYLLLVPGSIVFRLYFLPLFRRTEPPQHHLIVSQSCIRMRKLYVRFTAQRARALSEMYY